MRKSGCHPDLGQYGHLRRCSLWSCGHSWQAPGGRTWRGSRTPVPFPVSPSPAVRWGAVGEGHSPAPGDGWAGAPGSGPECEPSTAAEDRAVGWGWLHRHRWSLTLRGPCPWQPVIGGGSWAEGRRSVLNQPFLGLSELPSLRRAQRFSFPPPCCCWERASLGQPL